MHSYDPSTLHLVHGDAFTHDQHGHALSYGSLLLLPRHQHRLGTANFTAQDAIKDGLKSSNNE
jgi:hypothetical protein